MSKGVHVCFQTRASGSWNVRLKALAATMRGEFRTAIADGGQWIISLTFVLSVSKDVIWTYLNGTIPFFEFGTPTFL